MAPPCWRRSGCCSRQLHSRLCASLPPPGQPLQRHCWPLALWPCCQRIQRGWRRCALPRPRWKKASRTCPSSPSRRRGRAPMQAHSRKRSAIRSGTQKAARAPWTWRGACCTGSRRSTSPVGHGRPRLTAKSMAGCQILPSTMGTALWCTSPTRVRTCQSAPGTLCGSLRCPAPRLIPAGCTSSRTARWGGSHQLASTRRAPSIAWRASSIRASLQMARKRRNSQSRRGRSSGPSPRRITQPAGLRSRTRTRSTAGCPGTTS
mmetsp:Transcript_45463/g.126503  ORF Transcript_45463/g.126503 Transcript_45463/m.126503 type:complete len:262 (-) Transcript_45463:472-1257(-)